MIAIRAEPRLLGLAAAAVLALGGCGGDDETEPAATTTPSVAQSTTVPPASDTTEETTTEETTTEEDKPKRKRKKRGESGEGGAGDEEEARTEVRITGRDGTVKPTDIKVAPFIGIRVVIRSRDNHTYFVTFGNQGGFAPPRKSGEFRLDGLRPGESNEGRYLVDGSVKGTVRITGSSEPLDRRETGVRETPLLPVFVPAATSVSDWLTSQS